MKKNLVYHLKCKLCTAEYIGESYRAVITRIKEHLRDSQSKVFQHFRDKHHIKPNENHIQFEIIGSGYCDTQHRKEAESMFIAKRNPDINAVK